MGERSDPLGTIQRLKIKVKYTILVFVLGIETQNSLGFGDTNRSFNAGQKNWLCVN